MPHLIPNGAWHSCYIGLGYFYNNTKTRFFAYSQKYFKKKSPEGLFNVISICVFYRNRQEWFQNSDTQFPVNHNQLSQ